MKKKKLYLQDSKNNTQLYTKTLPSINKNIQITCQVYLYTNQNKIASVLCIAFQWLPFTEIDCNIIIGIGSHKLSLLIEQ